MNVAEGLHYFYDTEENVGRENGNEEREREDMESLYLNCITENKHKQ